jgi:hypothetical protein
MAWLTGYSYRKELTVDASKIDADLTDFPVLVHLHADLFTYLATNVCIGATATADSENGSEVAGNAIDANTATFWTSATSGTPPRWLKVDLGVGNSKTVRKYVVTIRSSDPNGKPTAWQLQGSNTGAFAGEETVLDSQTGQTFVGDGPNTYLFSNSTAYRYYRLYITATSGGVYVQIKEFAMHEASVNAANFDFSKARADLNDVKFTAADGSTELKHELDDILYDGPLYGSDILTGGTASGDTNGGAWATPANVVDNNEGTFGNSTDTAGDHWWKYDLGAGVTKTVTKVRFRPYNNAWGNSIKDFHIDGSNDNTNWDTLYTGQHANSNSWETYYFANTTAYRYYRIYMTTSWMVGHTMLGIYEAEMMESTSPVPDITQAFFWVKIPTVDDTVDTTFYIYYGNASETSPTEDPENVWDTYHKGVWHLGEEGQGVVGEYKDSTSNNNDARVGTGTVTQSELILGHSQKFATSRIDVPDAASLEPGTADLTWSFKLYLTSTGGNQCFIGRDTSGTSYFYFALESGTLRFRDYNSGNIIDFGESPSFSTGQVYDIEVVRSGTSFSIYKDNVQLGTSDTDADGFLDRAQGWVFGGHSTINYMSSAYMDEVRMSIGIARSAAWRKARIESDNLALLSFGTEETEPIEQFQLTPSLEWLASGMLQKAPSLEWVAIEANETTPGLEWFTSLSHKFIPNLVHYPIYFETPSIKNSKVPVAWSGCFPGFTVTMKDTGSSGTTTIEIYVNGILKSTLNIAADSLEYTKLHYVLMDTILSPLDELDVHVTAVATDADDLKVDLYQMTFPFDLEVVGIGNKQNSIEYFGRNREHLFNSADDWYIELNQPVLAADYLKVIDTNGQEIPLTPTLERGNFYNSRIRFSPYTDGVVDHFRIRVQDVFEVFHVFEVRPVTTPYMADFPEYFSKQLVSEVSGDTNLMTTGASAHADENDSTAYKAIDGIDNFNSYWATAPHSNDPSGLPRSWGYDFGLGNEKIITKFSIQPFNNQNGVYMKDFEIWGSNLAAPDLSDDADWEGIFGSQVLAVPSYQDFEFDNDIAYRWYRIKIKTNYRSDPDAGTGYFDCGIDELDAFEKIVTYTSVLELDCWLGAKYYRYSFDNGATWTAWLTIADTQKLSLDFDGKTTGTYSMKVQYQLGNNIVEDAFSILYAEGAVDASIQYLGEKARIIYEDDVPFNRVEVYYNDILEKTEVPTIYSGFETVTTNSTNKTITVAAGSVYYQNKKYTWAGNPYTVDPDFSSFDVMFRVLFGFNTKSGVLEFQEYVNETPGSGITESIEDFIPLWVIEYSITTQAADFSSYDVNFSTTLSAIPEASVPIETAEDRIIEVRVYDVAGRFLRSKWSPTKTIYNIWRSMVVTANPFSGSGYAGADIPENAVDDVAGSYWTSPLAGPLPAWLQHEFGIANKKTVVEYTIQVRTADANSKPTAWKLQGSNDGGGTWTDLDVVTGYTFAADGPFTFTIDTPGSYASYRLYITATSGGNYVQIREWELKDSIGGVDLIDPDETIEILPGEIHGFTSLDFTITSDDWEDPL